MKLNSCSAGQSNVLPEVFVRQWVLSMPWRLGFLLASDPALFRL